MQEVDVQQEDQKVKAILEWVARVRRAWDTQTNVNKKQDLYPECGLAQGTTHNSTHQYERGWGGDRGDVMLSFGLRGKAGL